MLHKIMHEKNLRSKVTQEGCDILSPLMVSLNNILYLKKKKKKKRSFKNKQKLICHISLVKEDLEGSESESHS